VGIERSFGMHASANKAHWRALLQPPAGETSLSSGLDAMLDECKTAADHAPPPPMPPPAPMAWPPGFGKEWLYIDNSGVEQGPFFLHEMRGCARTMQRVPALPVLSLVALQVVCRGLFPAFDASQAAGLYRLGLG
jgi:hypothetical protein